MRTACSVIWKIKDLDTIYVMMCVIFRMTKLLIKQGKGSDIKIMKMRWNGLTSSDLKWIAIISMLVDHFAVAIYANTAYCQFDIYRAMRGIGRIAFPIYCFLLVEGFYHTHDVKRYISRCFLFAVISEVPFDLAIHGTWFYPEGQNVFFTLAIGLCTLYAICACERRGMSIVSSALCVLIGAGTAQLLETDYHYLGVLCIVLFYYLGRFDKAPRAIIGSVAVGIVEFNASMAFLPIYLYNGERGMKLKYFFYWVYPVHLLVLGLIRVMLY